MSAAEALKAARAIGIDLLVDGDDLVLQASVAAPAPILELLSRHKAEIVKLLRPADEGWSNKDWHDFFSKRAAIAEFDGGLAPVQAEARAFDCCVLEWLNCNFVRSPPGRCLACDGDGRAHEPLLPHGVEPTGHAWLHDHCWPAWHAGRKALAIQALARMGLAVPAKSPDDFGKTGQPDQPRSE